jgi:hypothetical protein
MFERQGWHLISLLVLLAFVVFLGQGAVMEGSFLGVTTRVWLWIAIAIPVAHQIIIGLLWRGQLYHGWMTRWFGEYDFLVFKVIFTVLFVARPIAIILLAIANRNTLPLEPLVAYVLAALLFIPFAFTMYSVLRYFGLDRAFGEDHFDPQAYRDRPFVREGMFRYTDNAMYKFAFLILWVIAIALLSQAALLAAAFSHLYIWVHYYFTELPDMRQIYRKAPIDERP